MSKLTSRQAKIRIYDGTGTPYYLELDFDMEDFSGPMGTPKTEEILVLNRGLADSLMHHIEGPEDKMMGPVPISFSVMLRSATQTVNLLNWLAAMWDALATQVNSHTLVTTEADTQRDGANNNPVFADANKSTCDVLYLMETGGTDLGFRYYEVWFPPEEQELSESPDGITMALKGQVYGTVTRITAFPAGTDVEA